LVGPSISLLEKDLQAVFDITMHLNAFKYFYRILRHIILALTINIEIHITTC